MSTPLSKMAIKMVDIKWWVCLRITGIISSVSLSCCNPNFLLIISRALSEMKFSYLLKTDDDCFVDVVRILQRLDEIPDTTRCVWLGRSV